LRYFVFEVFDFLHLVLEDGDELVLGYADLEFLHDLQGVYKDLGLGDAFEIEEGLSFLAVVAGLVAIFRVEIILSEIAELELSATGCLIFTVFDHLG
jgi:hypothetical protein